MNHSEVCDILDSIDGLDEGQKEAIALWLKNNNLVPPTQQDVADKVPKPILKKLHQDLHQVRRILEGQKIIASVDYTISIHGIGTEENKLVPYIIPKHWTLDYQNLLQTSPELQKLNQKFQAAIRELETSAAAVAQTYDVSLNNLLIYIIHHEGG